MSEQSADQRLQLGFASGAVPVQPLRTYDPTLDTDLPSRQAMMQNLVELKARFDERLANQRQVIENLSENRQLLLAVNARYESFVRSIASAEWHELAPLELVQKAQELLNTQEETS